MNCFVVILPAESSVEGVEDKFPECEQLADRAWVVAGEQQTCGEVQDALGIGTTAKDGPESAAYPTGIVFRVSEVNGFAEESIWEKMRKWGL